MYKISLFLFLPLLLIGCNGGESISENSSASSSNNSVKSYRHTKEFIHYDSDDIPEFEVISTFNDKGYLITEEIIRKTSKDLENDLLGKNNSHLKFTITYDNEVATRIDNAMDGVTTESLIYSYNDIGLLSKVDSLIDNTSHIFSYDNKNLSKVVKQDLNTQENLEEYLFAYNDSEHLERITNSSYTISLLWNKNRIIQRTVDYNYNGNSHVTKFVYSDKKISKTIYSESPLSSREYTFNENNVVTGYVVYRDGKQVWRSEFEIEEGKCFWAIDFSLLLLGYHNRTGQLNTIVDSCSL